LDITTIKPPPPGESPQATKARVAGILNKPRPGPYLWQYILDPEDWEGHRRRKRLLTGAAHETGAETKARIAWIKRKVEREKADG
jgi:hypothetical protein